MDNVFLLFSFLGVKWNMVKMFTGLHKTSSSSNTFGIDQVDQFIKVTGGEKKSSQSWHTHTHSMQLSQGQSEVFCIQWANFWCVPLKICVSWLKHQVVSRLQHKVKGPCINYASLTNSEIWAVQSLRPEFLMSCNGTDWNSTPLNVLRSSVWCLK